jgi:uncharacterized protein YuzE
MKQRYLEITFRKGKPFAAYLHRPLKSGARAARTLDAGQGVHVDLDEGGAPIGIEITAPGIVTVDQLNAVLAEHGVAALDDDEWSPLAA